MNKGGLAVSRGLTGGSAYFTVGGPISRRQSEPARIHHRVTPRNNLPGDHERLSKPSYLFISPRLSPLASFLSTPDLLTPTPSNSLIHVYTQRFPLNPRYSKPHPQILPSLLVSYSLRIGNALSDLEKKRHPTNKMSLNYQHRNVRSAFRDRSFSNYQHGLSNPVGEKTSSS